VGLVGGLFKAGVAKKVYDEARKPQNQARIKDAVSRFRSKGGSSGGSKGGPAAR
jgi:hypothetical protein